MNYQSRKTEILAPAGDMERFAAAINFGADAVYFAGKEFGMRTASNNFTMDQMKQAVDFAHSKGKKAYVTCNTVLNNKQVEYLPEYLQEAQNCGVDAFIIADLGVMDYAKKYAPNVEIHMSTQVGIMNYASAEMLYNMGASRVVLARELSVEDIATLRAKTNKNLELEVFVHGSMCMSFSGRCLLSKYMVGRDANQGDCAQPCRWKYHLVEQTRPGQYFPIGEDENGSYIMNAKDMCMIEHLPDLITAGVDSFKIEGRAKSSYYVSVVTNAYRTAMDYVLQNGDKPLPQWIIDEVDKISHREYSTGFFYDTPDQVTSYGGYVRQYDVIGVVNECKDGRCYINQRNKFLEGDIAEILEPEKTPYEIKLTDLINDEGEKIDVAPHANMKLSFACDRNICPNSIIRIKK